MEELFGEIVEVGVDAGRIGLGLKLFDVVAAGGDEVAGQAGGLGGGEVVGGVSDEDAFVGAATEDFERLHGEARIRLAVGLAVSGPEDCAEVAVEPEMGENAFGMGVDFIGQDREGESPLAEDLQELLGTGQDGDVLIHNFKEVLAEMGFRFCGGICAPAKFTERDRDGATNRRPHFAVIALRKSELSLSVSDGPVDCRKVVDQRAVQVKEHSL